MLEMICGVPTVHPIREIKALMQIEGTQTKLVRGYRHDGDERGNSMIPPNGKMLRCDLKKPKSENVAAQLGHSPDLSPYDLIDCVVDSFSHQNRHVRHARSFVRDEGLWRD
jgi:hypothetical protein